MQWFFPIIIFGILSGCATNSVLITGGEIQPQVINQSPVAKAQLSEKVNKIEVVESKDIWDRLRNGFEIPDLAESDLVDQYIRALQAKPEAVNQLLERSSSYLFYIIEEVEARDLPSELALLPFIESAFNPKAVSPAKAAGMWQFMPATGKSFKLKQNMFKDERSDIIKSTRAALDYLQRLNYQFDDWPLALAAYNWGEGSVSRAIQKNQSENLTTDYPSLKMPKETRNYVPKLLAYKKIIADPERYGFKLPNVPNHPYFVEVPVMQDIDLDKAIELSDITKEQFIALNPSFTKPVILKEFNQSILLPYGKAEVFKDNVKNHQKPLATWTAVRVNKTDTVEKIAQQIQVTPSDIRLVNNIPNGMKIRTGSSLLIPKKIGHIGDIEADIAQNGLLILEKDIVAVPVKMNCRAKKCVAVPNKLPNYAPMSERAIPKSTNSEARKTKVTNQNKKENARPQSEKKSKSLNKNTKNLSTKTALDSKK